MATQNEERVNAGLSPHEIRMIAVKAFCDDRTVKAYLRGDGQRHMSRLRVEEALRALGHGQLVRAR